MAKVNFMLVSDEDNKQNVVVFVNGQTFAANSDHPNFARIVEQCNAGMESVADLFDVAQTVAQNFERLSDRVTARNGRIYLDGDEVNNALTKQILRFMDEDNDQWEPLVLFFENVLANPDDHSREQLFEWLDRRDFTITEDGFILGYKGVRRVPGENGEPDTFTSIHAGPAVVDDVEVDGHVPNNPGSTVTMARSSVANDPGVGCSVGLHVGTFDYARDFGQGAVLAIHVNPRDVVSVPTDCDAAKVRCCQYYVAGEVTEQERSALSQSRREAVAV
jgi:hypothetical protein